MVISRDFLAVVNDGEIPSRHADSLKGLTEVDSGRSYIQSGRGGVIRVTGPNQAREKDGFCACVSPNQHQDNQSSQVMCCVCFWACGSGPGRIAGPSSGKEPSVCESLGLVAPLQLPVSGRLHSHKTAVSLDSGCDKGTSRLSCSHLLHGV